MTDFPYEYAGENFPFEYFSTVFATVYDILYMPLDICGYRFNLLGVFMFTAVAKILWDIVESYVFDE